MSTEADVRRTALSLPESSEKPMYGTPAFYVRAKWFARLRETPETLVIPVDSEETKHELVAADPAKFFTEPHYDGYAALLIHLPAVDEQELKELLTDAWRLRAPKRLAALHFPPP
ncbi:MmcQ/YjbR family DNA-binding protein [Nonomuraea sp. NBC_01738]|uniref:MmcQ/YjbR family DNA-binding protein n=1 Tax=Nonomuraea sp. NBC_01738 TaxID=2976003 RepID=UPI002E0DAA18|nr:MmcQ/YjbR family DNA-binding protein [Nonomuraea sp. NBC_01738]